MEIIIRVEDGCVLSNIKKEADMDDSRMNYSIYARFFDEGCHAWENNAECNLIYLRAQEQYANELLRSRGHLFLNDVYDMLGMPRSKAGQVVGWIYDENNIIGDNCVDFDIYNDRNREFINGVTKIALLDFNVDGCILDGI